MTSEHKVNILEYYNDCEWQYRMMWKLFNNTSISIGYWDESVKSFKEALVHQHRKLAELVNIQPGNKVLDAGCGAGASAFYLAKNINCEVHGISLVPRQIELCKQSLEKEQLKGTVEFAEMDYHNLSYPDEFFDVVWALESFCYAQPKKKFIEEAFRVLKKGGRLIIVDLFQGKEILNEQESQLLYTRTMNPMAVASMDTMPQVARYIKDTGFSQCAIKDISQNVRRSKQGIFWLSVICYPFARIAHYAGRLTKREKDSFILGIYAARSYKQGLTIYGSVLAEK